MRTIVRNSTAAKLVCLALLLLFIAVCGLHVAGAHHDVGADGLGLGHVTVLVLLVLYAAAAWVLLKDQLLPTSRLRSPWALTLPRQTTLLTPQVFRSTPLLS